MIKILGTSHIAKQSVDEIRQTIVNEKPDIVAVELDVGRAAGLFDESKKSVGMAAILKIGVKGFLFAKIGQYVQQKLGKTVGIIPGADMKVAIETARKEKLQVAFIDQPIQITLRKLKISWRERFRFVGDLVKGIFSPKKQMKEFGMIDLRKVPEKEMIEKMMGHLSSRYPSVYKTLVEDRNKYMVKKLVKLLREHKGKKILAVVGAGHKKGMEEMLLKVEVV